MHQTITISSVGFANPPENFTCIARNQSFVLQWNLPNFNTTLIDKYVVIYEKEEYETADTFYQIPFESDKLYVDFQVYVKSQNRVLIDGIPNCCQILSSLERVTCKLVNLSYAVFYKHHECIHVFSCSK